MRGPVTQGQGWSNATRRIGAAAELKNMGNQLVGVVILNWNGLLDTIECLESLRGVTHSDRLTVVVDNGSGNSEPERIAERFPEVNLIRNDRNRGFAAGCNQGVSLALSRGAGYILLLNNDTTVEPGFLGVLLEHLQQAPNVGAVGPLVRCHESSEVWSAGGWINSALGIAGHYGKGLDARELRRADPREVDYVAGCAMLIRSEAIQRVGKFDEAYFAYYEDSDWCVRARRLGYSVHVVPASVVVHKRGVTAGSRGSNGLSALQAYLWGRNGIIFARKNLSGWRRKTFIMGQFTFRFAQVAALSEDVHTAGMYLRGLTHGLNYPQSPPVEEVLWGVK